MGSVDGGVSSSESDSEVSSCSCSGVSDRGCLRPSIDMSGIAEI